MLACREAWLKDPRFILGAALFVLGAVCNVHADYTLIALRSRGRSSGQGVDSTATSATSSPPRHDQRYRIPRGGLFEFVSAANYGDVACLAYI